MNFLLRRDLEPQEYVVLYIWSLTQKVGSRVTDDNDLVSRRQGWRWISWSNTSLPVFLSTTNKKTLLLLSFSSTIPVYNDIRPSKLFKTMSRRRSRFSSCTQSKILLGLDFGFKNVSFFRFYYMMWRRRDVVCSKSTWKKDRNDFVFSMQ